VRLGFCRCTASYAPLLISIAKQGRLTRNTQAHRCRPYGVPYYHQLLYHRGSCGPAALANVGGIGSLWLAGSARLGATGADLSKLTAGGFVVHGAAISIVATT
jgi:hypothetical protein